MSKKRFSEEQIIYALKQAESGRPVREVCRELGVSEPSSGVAPISLPLPEPGTCRAALKMRLRELAMKRVRFGWRRLTIPLGREGWPDSHKLVYRLYREMGLTVRSKHRRKIASLGRGVVPIPAAAATERWSMDFVMDWFENGRHFRILTLIDSHARECLAPEPAVSMKGRKSARQGLGRELDAPEIAGIS
jgi:hypothetical protein